MTEHKLLHNDPGLTITETAAIHILKMLPLAAEQNPIGIRVGVKKAGCTGYEYVLEYAYEGTVTQNDFTFEGFGAKVVVSQDIYLKFFKGGTQIDYRKEGINEGLKFDNPNVENECGCGESFSLGSDE